MFEEYPIREGSDSRPAENPINRGEQDGDLLRSLLIVANAVTNDDSLAYQSVLQALSDGLAYEKEKSEGISATWIYERTVQKSRLLARGIAPITARKPPEMSVDQRIWPLVEKFDWRERLLCVLHYSLGWPGAALASLLDVSEGAIQTQLSIFEQRFKNSLKDLRSENLAGFNWHQAVVDSIQRRYAVVDAEVKDLEDLLQQIQGNSLPENQKNAQSASLNGHLIGSVGLVVITICIVIVLLFVSKLSPIRQQLSHGYFPLGSTRQPDGQPLAGLPLTWLSSQKTIRERMQDSAKLWQTIFIETQLTDYGPASYIGAPRQYQLLAWIKQPDESIQLFGLLSQNPSQVNVVTKGHSFELNPLLNYSANGGFLGSPGTLLENETLRRMIFPVTAPWLSQQGTLRVTIRTESWSGTRSWSIGTTPMGSVKPDYGSTPKSGLSCACSNLAVEIPERSSMT